MSIPREVVEFTPARISELRDVAAHQDNPNYLARKLVDCLDEIERLQLLTAPAGQEVGRDERGTLADMHFAAMEIGERLLKISNSLDADPSKDIFVGIGEKIAALQARAQSAPSDEQVIDISQDFLDQIITTYSIGKTWPSQYFLNDIVADLITDIKAQSAPQPTSSVADQPQGECVRAWAVFSPRDTLMIACQTPGQAWANYRYCFGAMSSAEIKLKESGYTCREIEIRALKSDADRKGK